MGGGEGPAMSDAVRAPCRTPGPAASHPGHRHRPCCQHPGGILFSPPRIYRAPRGRADPAQPGSCPQPAPPAQRLPRGTGNCCADSALSKLGHRATRACRNQHPGLVLQIFIFTVMCAWNSSGHKTQHGQEAGTQPSDPSPPVPPAACPGAAAPVWSH